MTQAPESVGDYRRTEIGDIPCDWDVQAIGSLAETSSGTTPARQFFDRYYANGTTPWVKTLDLTNSSIFATQESVTAAALRETSLRVYPPGTVLVAMYGGFNQIGRTGLLQISAAVNQALTAIRPTATLMDSRFLLEFLNLRVTCWKSVASSSRKDANITGSDVRAFLVPIPPIREQKAIAGALSDVDALIDALDRLIAKKRDLKQAAMQQLLTGQTRLPGFKTAWQVKRVEEMGDVLAGKALNAQGPGRLRPYLRTKNVLDGQIATDDVLHMPFTEAEFERFRVKQGDVLLNEGQSLELVGRCSMYRGELVAPCAMQNQLLRFRAKEHAVAAFAEQLFRRCQADGVFSAIATQTTSVAHLGSVRFSNLPLTWPTDPSEQQAIAAVLSDMDADLGALEQRRDKTRLLKEGMMQELFTGRTRLV